MNSYKVLRQQVFSIDSFNIVPIRFSDKLRIMKWRNEQMYHLRQNKVLTEEDQNSYFENVVAKLFVQDHPAQILFSYLHNGECIGYGGLVHINWIDRNAEISFIMDTTLEAKHFELHWKLYLSLIQEVAFKELGLHKIYTYAFDLRPRLYPALCNAGLDHEATLYQHCCFNDNYIDVLIHSKVNNISLRKATLDDLGCTYVWATNPEVRKYSFNQSQITKEEHHLWFKSKINSDCTKYFILEDSIQNRLGSVRIDIDQDGNGIISYLIDPHFHGRKLGKKLLTLLEDHLKCDAPAVKTLIGYVMATNIPSIKIFESLGYKGTIDNESLKFTKQLA